MKTFKSFVTEVAEPIGGDEQKFKKRHTDATDKKDYPIKGQEHVFKGKDKAPARVGDAQKEVENNDDQYVDNSNAGMISRKIKRAVDESVIIEAVKAGTIMLKSGDKQKIAKDEAALLNKLFSQLNGSNKTKMEDRMTMSKDGFAEILQFAKNL